jgi:hypothetical protein
MATPNSRTDWEFLDQLSEYWRQKTLLCGVKTSPPSMVFLSQCFFVFCYQFFPVCFTLWCYLWSGLTPSVVTCVVVVVAPMLRKDSGWGHRIGVQRSKRVKQPAGWAMAACTPRSRGVTLTHQLAQTFLSLCPVLKGKLILLQKSLGNWRRRRRLTGASWLTNIVIMRGSGSYVLTSLILLSRGDQSVFWEGSLGEKFRVHNGCSELSVLLSTQITVKWELASLSHASLCCVVLN